MSVLLAFLPALLMYGQEPLQRSDLKSDEVVQFLPTWGLLEEGVWRVPVDAWVYEPEEDDRVRNSALSGIDEVLALAGDDAETRARVIRNLRPFLVDNERGKTVVVRLGDTALALTETGPDGRSRGTLEVAAKALPGWITLEVVPRRGDARRFHAEAQLLDDAGVSVISDLDDTIKVTEVHDKQRVIANTFVEPPRAVTGMSAAYRRLAAEGADFHYVSSSPLPLLGAIRGFLAGEDFPRGSIALRPFRWRDGSVLDLLGHDDFKRDEIEKLVSAFDERRFVLIGDLGERDPEIYANVARAYPERVTAIWLRDPIAGGTPDLDERLAATFADLPAGLWSVFVEGSELPLLR